MPTFVDAFSVIDDIFGKMTPEEEIEMRYYDILGDISVALVNYRSKHNLNQKQLSERLGVAQSMVSKYESGDYNISIKALNDLCGKLGFSLEIKLNAIEESVEPFPIVILDSDDATELAA